MINSGQQALISMLAHLTSITIAWIALQSLNLDNLFKKNHVFQARVLYILLSIVIGSTVANFFLDYFFWSQQLPYLLN